MAREYSAEIQAWLDKQPPCKAEQLDPPDICPIRDCELCDPWGCVE